MCQGMNPHMDFLYLLDGTDLRGHSLIDRKENLETLMKNALKNLHFSQYIIGKGKESFEAACQAELEEIVGKKSILYTAGQETEIGSSSNAIKGRNSSSVGIR